MSQLFKTKLQRDVAEVLVAFGVSLLLMTGFLVLVDVVFNQYSITPFDIVVTDYIISLRNSLLNEFMIFITMFGKEFAIVITCILCVVFIQKRMWRYLFSLLFLMMGSVFLNFVLKTLFARPRPTDNVLFTEAYYSFPSGHTMTAFTLFSFLIYLTINHIKNTTFRLLLIVIWIVLIIGVGFSRVYLGVHFPTDIIAGYLVSLLWLLIFYGVRESRDLKGILHKSN